MEIADDLPVRKTSRDAPKSKGGRPRGSLNKMSLAVREAAARTGLLPHEILLSMARGEPVRIVKVAADGSKVETWQEVDLETVKDAAGKAAPYFAPKMSAVEVISGVSDSDLDELIKSAAAEAGVGLAVGGEGAADPD